MPRLLVGAEADLGAKLASAMEPCHPPESTLKRRNPREGGMERTDGITWLPRNRLRTRLSMPLGLRQLAATHLNRSLWCREKRFVPVEQQLS